jgi:hypothetical protein
MNSAIFLKKISELLDHCYKNTATPQGAAPSKAGAMAAYE